MPSDDMLTGLRDPEPARVLQRGAAGVRQLIQALRASMPQSFLWYFPSFYVGEDVIKPGTWYRLDGSGDPVECRE